MLKTMKELTEYQKRVFVLLVICLELTAWKMLCTDAVRMSEAFLLFLLPGVCLTLMEISFPHALAAGALIALLLSLPGSFPAASLGGTAGILGGIVLCRSVLLHAEDVTRAADTVYLISAAMTFLTVISLGLWLLLH